MNPLFHSTGRCNEAGSGNPYSVQFVGAEVTKEKLVSGWQIVLTVLDFIGQSHQKYSFQENLVRLLEERSILNRITWRMGLPIFHEEGLFKI